jgi:OPT oligopeptide transporter protein
MFIGHLSGVGAASRLTGRGSENRRGPRGTPPAASTTMSSSAADAASEDATQAWNDPSLHASHHSSHHSHQSHNHQHKKTRPFSSRDNLIDGQDDEDDHAVDAGESEEAPNEDFTLRSTLVGLAIGALICLTNTTLGLQSGWITMASLQAALLGFGVFKAIPPSVNILGRRLKLIDKPFTPQENSVLQATAVAVGGMPLSAGLVGILPALAKLDPERDGGAQPIKLGWLGLLGWCLALAFFGVFL